MKVHLLKKIYIFCIHSQYLFSFLFAKTTLWLPAVTCCTGWTRCTKEKVYSICTLVPGVSHIFMIYATSSDYDYIVYFQVRNHKIDHPKILMSGKSLTLNSGDIYTRSDDHITFWILSLYPGRIFCSLLVTEDKHHTKRKHICFILNLAKTSRKIICRLFMLLQLIIQGVPAS